jgi:hypothetical protein
VLSAIARVMNSGSKSEPLEQQLGDSSAAKRSPGQPQSPRSVRRFDDALIVLSDVPQ